MTDEEIDISPEQALAIQMAGVDGVPCIMGDKPECEGCAVEILIFNHEEPTSCEKITASPVCKLHSVALQRGVHPFWRLWLGVPGIRCDRCATPLRLVRIVPIGSYFA